MRDFIVENFTELYSLDLITIVLNNSVALALGLFMMFTYKLSYSGAAYNRKFNVSLGMICIITTMIMSVISNNIALSLGMVGALSIIRFRTAVKDVRDSVFIFWAVAVGVGCGVSQYLLLGVGSAFLFFFLLAFKQISPDNKRLLIINGKVELQNRIEGIVETYFDQSVHLVMKNATAETCEYVYSIPERALKIAKDKNEIDIIEKLVKNEGIYNVNLVEQVDDIGR